MRRSIAALLFALALLAPAAAQVNFLALCKTGTAEQVSRALAAGANPSTVDQNGLSPLMYAAALNRDGGVVAALLKAGADARAQDRLGDTALMWAAAGNANPEIVAILVKAGSPIGARGDNGATALMMAAWKNGNPAVI
jgi:uncharacterized protein